MKTAAEKAWLHQFRRRLRRAWGFSRKQARAIQPIDDLTYPPQGAADECASYMADDARLCQ